MSESLTVDPSKMTLGDLEDFEDYTGKPFEKAFPTVLVLDENGDKVLDDKGRPATEVHASAKAIVALTWIIRRRSNAGFTIEDARNTSIGELQILAGGDEGNDVSGKPS